MALAALIAPVRQLPGPAMSALRTGEPIRPAEPVQVVQTVGVGPEPRLELAERARIVLSGLGLAIRLLYSAKMETPIASYLRLHRVSSSAESGSVELPHGRLPLVRGGSVRRRLRDAPFAGWMRESRDPSRGRGLRL